MSTPEIIGLDPGTTHSAILRFQADGPVLSGLFYGTNTQVLDYLRIISLGHEADDRVLAIEMIASYGMPVGREVFETCVWIGRFWEAADPIDVVQVYRKDVKLHLCGSSRAKDGNIRQALIDRFGPVGRKKSPGPLWGLSGDLWAALAVAVTYSDSTTYRPATVSATAPQDLDATALLATWPGR